MAFMTHPSLFCTNRQKTISSPKDKINKLRISFPLKDLIKEVLLKHVQRLQEIHF